MTHVLFLIVISNTHISTQAIPFSNSSNCMQAIQKFLEMEKKDLTIKARCVVNNG